MNFRVNGISDEEFLNLSHLHFHLILRADPASPLSPRIANIWRVKWAICIRHKIAHDANKCQLICVILNIKYLISFLRIHSIESQNNVV